MAVRNVKRGFNRLFVVLSVVWVVYCTIIFPLNESGKAFQRYQLDQRVCYERGLDQGPKLNECLKLAEDVWRAGENPWTFKNFYVRLWPLILAAVVGLPLFVYGCVRGIAAIFLWIWRGYKTEPNVPS